MKRPHFVGLGLLVYCQELETAFGLFPWSSSAVVPGWGHVCAARKSDRNKITRADFVTGRFCWEGLATVLALILRGGVGADAGGSQQCVWAQK